MNRQVLNSGLFLSGLYSQNIEVISLATQDLQDNLKKQLAGSDDDSQGLTEEDKEGLKQFFGLIWDNFNGDNIIVKTIAKIKLAMAYTFMSEDVNPITNLLNGLIPYRAGDSLAFQSTKDTRIKDLDYFTDYTHHKLLLVDGKSFQLGGRNIEDSYHVSKPNHTLTTKYLFMDTDSVVKLYRPSKKMIKSFNRLFHYTKMTASIDEIRSHAPNDVVANLEHIKKICDNDNACIANSIKSKKHFMSLSERLKLAKDEFEQYATKYEAIKTNELNQKLGVNSKDSTLASSEKLIDHSLHFTSRDLRGAKVEYLENLHLDPSEVKSSIAAKSLAKKTYGAPYSLSTNNSNKNIHAAVYESIENACETSRRQNQDLNVVVHNAYFAPPAKMLETFSKLSHGDWKCPKLSVEVLTNSVETTDLAVINLFGRRAMGTYLKVHNQVKNRFSSPFKYSEYQTSNDSTDKVKYSLHSKVFVMGHDVIVGSANADYRSYMMDTNNAIRIKNAPVVASKYIKYYRNISQNIKDKTQEFSNLKSTTNIPSYLLSPYKDTLSKATMLGKSENNIELIDTLDHAFVGQALDDLEIEHELFTPRLQAELKLGAIKVLRMVENRSNSVVSKWGSEFKLYKKQYDIAIKLCMQNYQPITRKRCQKKLLRETKWPATFHRREKQRRNDAKSLDNLFKYI